MDFTLEDLGNGTAVARLSGRLDIAGNGEIETRFTAAAADKRYLIADLSGVSFLASIGIRTLFAKAKMMQGRGGRMVITGAIEPVAQVLDITGVQSLIPIFPDIAAAQSHLAGLADTHC